MGRRLVIIKNYTHAHIKRVKVEKTYTARAALAPRVAKGAIRGYSPT